MKFITSDNVQLTYTDEGEGQPIVILTGIGGHKLIWKNQVNFLLDHHYRVINVDARNQGMSQRTFKGQRIFKHAQDIHELMTDLNLQDPVLMGNSMGAATFLAYFALYGDQHVKAFIDVDQSPKMLQDQEWAFGFKNLAWDNFPYLIKNDFGKATFHEIDATLYQEIKLLNEQYPYHSDQNQSFLEDHAMQDWRDVIVQLKIPYLIIAGKQSPYFDYHFAEVVANFNSHGQFKVIENAGHIVMAEQPEKFNEVLHNFLLTL